MATVTTHVLDISRGQPASGIGVEVFRLLHGQREFITKAVTNANGRCRDPLLSRDGAEPGTYLIEFHLKRYFGAPSLLDIVPVEINLLDVCSHYHVPLVIAPGGYSTYRGAPPHRAPDDQGMWNIPAAGAEEPAAWQVAPLPGTAGPGLTVHVIDVAQGCGAAGLRVEVTYIGDGPGTTPVRGCATNAEGRTNPWLVEPGTLRAGTYELIFHTGDYFLAAGFPVGASQFFPRARVRLNVTDARTHWHIPLIVSPWGYSCYRGS